MVRVKCCVQLLDDWRVISNADLEHRAVDPRALQVVHLQVQINLRRRRFLRLARRLPCRRRARWWGTVVAAALRSHHGRAHDLPMVVLIRGLKRHALKYTHGNDANNDRIVFSDFCRECSYHFTKYGLNKLN